MESVTTQTDIAAAPLVSVCVVTYQHVNYIRQCLDGILNQRVNFDFELLIGEDDSTDGTREICLEYAERYPSRVRLFLRSRKDVIYLNNLPTGRFNFTQTYLATRGKYVALCEGDDYWTDPDKLQMQVNFLEQNPEFSLTHTNVNHVNKNGSVLVEAPLQYKDVMTHGEVVGKITVQTLTMVFRKESLLVFPAEYYKIFNADVFLTALLSEKGKVKFFSQVTGCYRKHEGGTYTSIGFKKKQVNRLATLQTMLHYFPSAKVKSNLKSAISKTYARILYADITTRQYGDFGKMLLKTIYFDVTNFKFSFAHLINHAIKNRVKK
jgi:glycosyltransferase involved in cell wall biosynthesis